MPSPVTSSLTCRRPDRALDGLATLAVGPCGTYDKECSNTTNQCRSSSGCCGRFLGSPTPMVKWSPLVFPMALSLLLLF
jgi:hypothetical protein